MNVTDATLVLGALKGDRSAFAELYDRRARYIRAVCYDETRNLDVAADLTQEAFLRAWRGLAELREPQRFAPWLAGIVRQVCREWRRARRRETSRLALLADHLAAQGPPREPEPPDDRLAELRAAIAGDVQNGAQRLPALREQERLALHAYYLQGLSVEEARTVLGLSRSSFYRVLASACERLRRVPAQREVKP